MRELARVFVTMSDRFFLSSSAVTRAGPHIRDASNVQRLWNYFVIASLPAWLIGVWSLGHQTHLAMADFQLDSLPGWRSWLLSKSGIGFDAFSVTDCFIHGFLYFLPIFAVALLTGAFWQSLFSVLRRKPPDEGLLYIAWFFALMMPATAPLYQVALGMTFGIVIGKLIYGGSGRYLVNPALLGVAFLVFFLSIPVVWSRRLGARGWLRPAYRPGTGDRGGRLEGHRCSGLQFLATVSG